MVAANALARSRIVTHSNAASFLIRTILFENTNIPFSKNYFKLGKMMLDSERTFKVKVRFRWTVFEISLPSAIKEFCMETRLSNIFKTINVTNLSKVIQESSYRVLQVTSK